MKQEVQVTVRITLEADADITQNDLNAGIGRILDPVENHDSVTKVEWVDIKEEAEIYS